MRSLLAVVILSACGGSSKPASTTTSPDVVAPGAAGSAAARPMSDIGVGVALTITQRDATVTIDDQVFGHARELDPVIALMPGLHTLEVAHPGFKTYRAEFSVTDKVETFTVNLERAP